MKRLIQTLVGIFAIVAVVFFVAPAPAWAAYPTDCTSGWTQWYGPSWGKMRSCWALGSAPEDPYSHYYWKFQVQDTQTDGYAVHLEACADSAWNDNGSIHNPYSCHNPGTPPPYSPLWGLQLIDRVGDTGVDYCPQSSGAVVTTIFPSAATPQAFWDPQHSYFEVAIVKGRCEGAGGYQAVAWYPVVQVSSGSPGTLQ